MSEGWVCVRGCICASAGLYQMGGYVSEGCICVRGDLCQSGGYVSEGCVCVRGVS